jgi:hypothetical protein
MVTAGCSIDKSQQQTDGLAAVLLSPIQPGLDRQIPGLRLPLSPRAIEARERRPR